MKFLLYALILSFVLAGQASAKTLYPLLSVDMKSANDDSVSIAVQLFSYGANGIFISVDGKTIGKVVVMETDPKFRMKRYLANWDNNKGQFGCVLQHRLDPKEDGKPKASFFQLNWDGMSYSSKLYNILPAEELIAKRDVLVSCTFAEKPGGLNHGDLAFLLFPLPVEYYEPEPEVRYTNNDTNLNTGATSARFHVRSTIPTEHILTYIRASTLNMQVTVASDTPFSE